VASTEDIHPDKAIRRFDVFAEYTRLERLDKDYPKDEAKGYGIWLAKVVASRNAGSKPSGKKHPGPEPKFRSIGDELQTDETFDQDIVDRMGTKFYSKVFSPAIEEARDKGEKYEDIRDSIRKDWKPEKRATKKTSD
jgi:hypothetical protein